MSTYDWKPVSNPPERVSTPLVLYKYLVAHRGYDEPMKGWWNGEDWRIEGAPNTCTEDVTHYTELPVMPADFEPYRRWRP